MGCGVLACEPSLLAKSSPAGLCMQVSSRGLVEIPSVAMTRVERACGANCDRSGQLAGLTGSEKVALSAPLAPRWQRTARPSAARSRAWFRHAAGRSGRRVDSRLKHPCSSPRPSAPSSCLHRRRDRAARPRSGAWCAPLHAQPIPRFPRASGLLSVAAPAIHGGWRSPSSPSPDSLSNSSRGARALRPRPASPSSPPRPATNADTPS
jgi:hypothetical protein